MKKIYLFNTIIFVAAFLLFQIELIIAKIILPVFGGSYLVWGACVVFFQGFLLLGYMYSHVVLERWGIYRYRYWHLVLLFLPLFFFPGRIFPKLHSSYNLPFVIDVSWQLLLSIGPVFFVLSTTSIIFQRWLAESELPERNNPYILYAVSNIGSFAALLSYPFFFEPRFDLDEQLFIWRFGYVVLLALNLIAYLKVKIISHRGEEKKKFFRWGFSKENLRWLLLGAAGVIMFLSVTNIITYEIAPIPLLWIIPLAIYLLSFTLNFQKNPWCPSWIRENFHVTVGLSIILFFLTQKGILPFIIGLIGFLILLFIICMFCQNELHRHRPKEADQLTEFYLFMAFGGFLGGILVSWIIPLISTFMIEYLIGLLVISIALKIDDKKKNIGAYGIRLILYSLFFLILWPIVFERYNFFGIILIFIVFRFIYTEFKKMDRAFFMAISFVVIISPFIEPLWSREVRIGQIRNYYGIYNIYYNRGKIMLKHGTTVHGAQYLYKEGKKEALTYYHRLTPVGELMLTDIFKFNHIGSVGLGTGALASYVNEGKDMDFFEIDPDVYAIANKFFSYLKYSSGKINFIFGDARLSLAKIKDKRYDILIIDAFSGDSIPIHLLTVDAIADYLACLADNGIILFHVSNRYLNLVPVLFSNADFLKAYAAVKSNKRSADGDADSSTWVALTWDGLSFQKLILELKWTGYDSKVAKSRLHPWTDKYSNVSSILKLENIFDNIRNFKVFYW